MSAVFKRKYLFWSMRHRGSYFLQPIKSRIDHTSSADLRTKKVNKQILGAKARCWRLFTEILTKISREQLLRSFGGLRCVSVSLCVCFLSFFFCVCVCQCPCLRSLCLCVRISWLDVMEFVCLWLCVSVLLYLLQRLPMSTGFDCVLRSADRMLWSLRCLSRRCRLLSVQTGRRGEGDETARESDISWCNASYNVDNVDNDDISGWQYWILQTGRRGEGRWNCKRVRQQLMMLVTMLTMLINLTRMTWSLADK